MKTQMSGCVLWQDHLYGFDQSDLTCIDLDGKRRWHVRDYDNGAVTIADGRLLIMSSDGELIVAPAQPDAYEELSKTEILDPEGARFWTVPILADGLIYCRSSLGALVCRDHRGVNK